MGEGIVGMWSEERGEHLMVRVFSLHAEDGERLTASVWLISVFELWECLRDWERVLERLRETVWVGVWNLHVAKISHISGVANRVKRVLKARISIESRVFKTRDAINIYCFKIGQLTILLDTLCYLARGFLNNRLPFHSKAAGHYKKLHLFRPSIFEGLLKGVQTSTENIHKRMRIASFISRVIKTLEISQYNRLKTTGPVSGLAAFPREFWLQNITFFGTTFTRPS